MHTIDSLFDWFLSATLRGSLLIVLVLLVQTAIGRRLPAGWRHALWLPVLFVLGSPLLPRSPWSVENQWQVTTVQMPSAAAGDDVNPAPSSDAPIAAVTVPATISWRTVTGWIWLAGALSVLLTGVIACLRELAAFRLGSRSLSADLRAEIDDAARTCGLRQIPRVLLSPTVPGPAMTGLLRPFLLLPASFETAFDREERRLILRHEFTHVKRGDLIVNSLVVLLQALHWCNPLVWFAFLRFRADRELACDNAVLSMDRGDERSRYGHVLLKVEHAEGPMAWRLGFLGLVGLFGRGRLLTSRITAIAGHRPAPAFWNLAGPALLLAVTLTGATRAQNPPPADAPQIVIETRFIELPADQTFEIKSATATHDPVAGTTVFAGDSVEIDQTNSIPGADVLSAPTLLTLSGQKATVEIGTPKPDASGKPRFVGTRLETLPTLVDGKIDLAIHLQRTSQKEGEGTDTFSTHDLKTHLSLVPGHTAMVTWPEAKDGEQAISDRRLILTIRARLADDAALIRDRLAKIIIPTIEFRDVPLGDALVFLREKTKELDPEKKGINLVSIPAKNAPEPRLTVSFKEIPLSEALKYIAALSDLEVEFGDPAVILRQPSTERYAAPSTGTAPSGNSATLAAGLTLTSVEFAEATLPAVLQFLQKKSVDLDPEKRGLNLILDAPGEPTPESLRITLSLRDVSISDVLRYVAELSNLKLRYDDEAVVLFRD